jgi:hypothetical protein
VSAACSEAMTPMLCNCSAVAGAAVPAYAFKQCGGAAGPGASCRLGAACRDGVWPGTPGQCTNGESLLCLGDARSWPALAVGPWFRAIWQQCSCMPSGAVLQVVTCDWQCIWRRVQCVITSKWCAEKLTLRAACRAAVL